MKTHQLIAIYIVFASAGSAFSQHSGQHHDPAAQGLTGQVNASPYAGEQSRDIKSLSTSDVAGLQNGAGMAYAKAAELNGYPGPTHVLELAAPLKLTPEQRKASELLMQQHKIKARELGAQLINAERTLDCAFASKQIDAARISDLTQRIGALQATLRAEHLQTHLAQTALLDSKQIADYQVLRGYGKSSGAGHSNQH